jgi:hypothetical protein
MLQGPRVKQWQQLRVERRASTVQHLQHLHGERVTRAPGAFYGTQVTANGDVQRGPRLSDVGRSLCALILLAAIVATTGVGLDIVRRDLLVAGRDVLHRTFPVVRPARPRTGTVTIDTRSVQSVAELSALLQRTGLIANATIFYWYWYLRPSSIDGGEQIAAGVHVLKTGMTMEEIAQALSRHRSQR